MSILDNCYRAAIHTYHFFYGLVKRCLNWRRPVTIQEEGVIARLPEVLSSCGAQHPMLVTDAFLRQALAPGVETVLQNAGIAYTVFSDVPANPTVAVCESAREIYKTADCDSFIALGGGAPMDVAKGVGALMVRPKKTLPQMTGALKVGRDLPPLIAIPTTAGTGSETTIAAVIVDQETSHKAALMDIHLVPRYALLDPTLTEGLPPFTTATTGLDALVHALESYISVDGWRTTDTNVMGEDTVRIVFHFLERAVENGGDLEARAQMQMAAHKGGYAFTRVGVGNVHAIAHTLGGLYNTPHGLANAVILPYVLRDYGSKIHKRLAYLAEITGVALAGTDEEKAEAFIAEIEAMNRRMGIPEKFDFIRDEDVEQIITWAKREVNHTYPVPVVYTRKDFRRIISQIRA